MSLGSGSASLVPEQSCACLPGLWAGSGPGGHAGPAPCHPGEDGRASAHPRAAPEVCWQQAVEPAGDGDRERPLSGHGPPLLPPDSASEPGGTAKLLCIDVVKLKGHLCLTFTGNGAGMTPHKLRHMLSFGFTEKAEKRDLPTCGSNGNGFQSGSMRLGKDAIVFTKNGGALSVGLFSQTYLEGVHAEEVTIPLVPFNQQNKKIIVTEDSVLSLKAILEHTLFNTQEELLAQFDDIPGKKGTRVLIWNIHRDKDGKPELDFDTDKHDIRLADFLAEIPRRTALRCQEKVQECPAPEMEYSLRAYCSVLYLKPCVQIVLRQKKVNTQLITKSLANTEHDLYKPRFSSERVKITFGFNCKNKNHYGIMMYHKNRLIRSYKKVGCQKKGEGVGVIGVIECNFLKPAHNKQDFEESKEYQRMIFVLGQKLNNYWKAKMQQINLGNTDAARVIADRPDQIWVQCEECLKWRRLPDRTDLTSFPEQWFCHLHPLHKYSLAGPYPCLAVVLIPPTGETPTHDVGASSHTRVLEEQPDTSLADSVPRWERCCLEALPSGSAEDQKTGVIQGGQKEQMPKLKAKRQPADMSVCVNACRSTKDVEKKPFLPVVSVLKAATGGEAPIQLCPFGWQQRLHKLKVEKAPHLGDGDRGGKELQVLNKQEQEGMTEREDVRRAVENISVELKNVSAERDLLRCKVEEIEREKCCLKTELLESQQELATLRSQKVEGLYWSEKHMGYCQAELQELKAKLARSAEEKAELMERLKDTKMQLEVLREAQVSCRGPEKDDVKR
uniref:MORC family CW-type zinc finger 4 n=1 Tax=Anas zonorhyncha TaxID=75864 RepID=A0A8B9UFS9_9AVES